MKQICKQIIESNNYLEVSNFLDYSLLKSLKINYSNTLKVLKTRISSFLEIDEEEIKNFTSLNFCNQNLQTTNNINYNNTVQYIVILCTEGVTDSLLTILKSTLKLEITFSRGSLIILNCRNSNTLNNLVFKVEHDSNLLIVDIVDNKSIQQKINQNKQVELNRNLLVINTFQDILQYNKDSMIGYLSSLYSVCSCRVSKLNKRNITILNDSKEGYYSFNNNKNPILSLHIVVVSGSCKVYFESNQNKELVTGEILSIYNVGDIESFISKFYFLNLREETKIDVYGLHLNKVD